MFEELDDRFIECLELREASEFFDSSYRDILDNWDHYYQIYLELVGDIKQ